MQLEYLEHSFSTDQQSKILKQIQSINKKLINNTHFSKSNTNSNRSNKIPLQKKQVDDKYFSQQCQQLFNDQSYNHKDKNTINDQQSLFNSKNQMLLDNQYQKEVKYFKEFQTDKYASIGRSKSNYSSKNKIKQTACQQNNSSFKQNTLVQKAKPLSIKKSQAQIKNLAQTKMKRFIQNKQNIFPSSYNIPSSSSNISSSYKMPTSNYNNSQNLASIYSKNSNQKKSTLKEVKNKIMCDYLLTENPVSKPQTNRKYTLTERAQTLLTQTTQQNQQLLNQQQENDSLELFQKRNKQPKHKFIQKDQNFIKKSFFKRQSNKSVLQCTFKPNILKKSNDIAQNLQPSFERLTQDMGSRSQAKLPYKTKQQISSKKYSCKRLQQLSQPRRLKTTVQDEQQKQYSFKPTLSKKSLQQMANCTLDVASRNKLWLQQKEAKICRLKTQEQETKLKRQSSSFVPKINNYKGQSQVHLSRFAKQGMSNYFERISMAKQRNSNLQKKKPQNQQKQSVNLNPAILKKKTYEQAVKQLHNKIMNMNL